MKSAYYVATVDKAYREAIDAYYTNAGSDNVDPVWIEEISKASHREFTTGFYLDKPSGNDQIYHTSSYVRDYDFVGMVVSYDKETGVATVEQRNRMFTGEEIEVVKPEGPYYKQYISSMKNADGECIEVAPHPQMTVYMPMDQEVGPFTMLRRKGTE